MVDQRQQEANYAARADSDTPVLSESKMDAGGLQTTEQSDNCNVYCQCSLRDSSTQ